jgi:hypothetical protein
MDSKHIKWGIGSIIVGSSNFQSCGPSWSDIDDKESWKKVYGSFIAVDRGGGDFMVFCNTTPSGYAWNATFADNQWSSIILNGDDQDGWIGPAVRLQADDSEDGYIVYCANNWIWLYRMDDHVTTQLDSINETDICQGGYEVKLTIIGTSLKVYVNDVEKLSATDGIYSSGRAGIGGGNNGQHYISYWEGGNI